MNNKLLKLLVVNAAVFSCAISWAIDIDKEIVKLKTERNDLMSAIKKYAGGDSTIAYRWLLKDNQKMIDKIDRDILILETVQNSKAKL